jgi:hypothetical protein
MGEVSLARDHAIALVENWIEGSLDPLFHAFNNLTHTVRPPLGIECLQAHADIILTSVVITHR